MRGNNIETQIRNAAEELIGDVGHQLRPLGLLVAIDSCQKLGKRLLFRISFEGPPVAQCFPGEKNRKVNWLLPAENYLVLPGEESMFHSPVLIRKTDGTPFKKSDIADLEELEIVSSLWVRSRYFWHRFVKNAKGNELMPADFIRLESGLNSYWTSASSRQRDNMVPLSADGSKINTLRRLETLRQVNIQSNMEIPSDLRLPHPSHRGRLCPYQTPESKNIGFQLFRTLGSDYLPPDKTGKGTLKPSRGELLSLAVGLVPYPHHNDGPRLSMGGKNLKQAVENIRGAEPPLVPGHIEGRFLASYPELASHAKRGRFTPYLGTNVLVAVMPWEGMTYEDGLVVSRDLARKLDIPEEKTRQSILFQDFDAGEDPESWLQTLSRELAELPRSRYHFGDPLPLPPSLKKVGPRPFYEAHTPGQIRDITFEAAIGRHRKSRQGGRHRHIDLEITWTFSICRLFGLGDKITGRHGNKGVATAILENPPIAVIGGKSLPIDLIISPCSILGRKNMGQFAEMVHGLLLKINTELPELSELPHPSRDEPGPWREWLQALPKLGADEKGTFEIRTPDAKPLGRAFCGIQYISRLHHHAEAKLQARGSKGPDSPITGQPRQGGTRSGQKLGEMENWSLLSHLPQEHLDSLDVLIDMRSRHSSLDRTWLLARTIMNCLGMDPGFPETSWNMQPYSGPSITLGTLRNKLNEIEDGSPESTEGTPVSILTEAVIPAAKKKDKVSPTTTIEQQIRQALETLGPDGLTDIPGVLKTIKLFEPHFPENIRDTLQSINNARSCAGKNKDKTSGTDDKGHKTSVWSLLLLFGHDRETGTHGIPVCPGLCCFFPKMQEALRKLITCLAGDMDESINARRLLDTLNKYQQRLLDLLKGKDGLLRGNILGCRLRHSGRAVIVPRPELPPDTARLPVQLLCEILQGHPAVSLLHLKRQGVPIRPETLRRLAHDPQTRPEAARILDEALQERSLRGFLIRQPSLHRHNIMAFRLRCWTEPVIAIPPMVTPGYNADFDGDTMAVFLPPHPEDENLAAWSLPWNPGKVGDGSCLISSENDLALGWLALPPDRQRFWANEANGQREEFPTLSSLVDSLISSKGQNPRELNLLLGSLQEELAASSTASCTLPPLDMERLFKKCQELSLSDEAVSPKKLLDKDSDLEWMISGKAKGKEADLKALFISPTDTKNNDGTPLTAHGLWEGLSDDDLFNYSTPSRVGMVSKKLAVAEAGYLSRLLAEGLYDVTITEPDCGTSQGLELAWIPDPLGLAVTSIGSSGTANPISLPLSGKDGKELQHSLSRYLWGRFLLDMERPLDNRDISDLATLWAAGRNHCREDLTAHLAKHNGKLLLRSPLTCRSAEPGLCTRCCGTDVSCKLFDSPSILPLGTRVGLTAAQAIGERGTQLAMKAFHDTASAGKGVTIGELKQILVSKPTLNLAEMFANLILLISDQTGDGAPRPDKNLPQSLIHFEIALRSEQGLREAAGKTRDRQVSALTYENVRKTLYRPEKDALASIKSRVLLEPAFRRERSC